MESKLLHSRVLSSSSKVLSCTSNPVRSHENGVQIFTPWSCSSSFKGMSLKASYSPAQFPRKGIDLVPHQTLLLEDESSMINGVNGTFLKSRSRQSFLLDAHDDEYEGIMVDSDKLPSNPQVFASMLEASLFQWKLKGKKGVWLKLPLERSELVPIAVKEGFTYHHAERGYVMLTYWIPEGPCMLPANASHQVGVGGFVINDKNEVLVVQEKHCAPAFKNDWKLPTGFILESEEIYNGVIREVKEETGIVTEFVEVIAFRHAHRVAFDKSDLLFICMLKPLTSQIVVDGQEIKATKWMLLDEFVQSIQGDSMFKKIARICLARLRKHYCGLSAHHVVSKFDGKTSSLYYNVVEPQDFNCRRTEDKQLFSSSNVHCMQYLGL